MVVAVSQLISNYLGQSLSSLVKSYANVYSKVLQLRWVQKNEPCVCVYLLFEPKDTPRRCLGGGSCMFQDTRLGMLIICHCF